VTTNRLQDPIRSGQVEVSRRDRFALRRQVEVRQIERLERPPSRRNEHQFDRRRHLSQMRSDPPRVVDPARDQRAIVIGEAIATASFDALA